MKLKQEVEEVIISLNLRTDVDLNRTRNLVVRMQKIILHQNEDISELKERIDKYCDGCSGGF